MNDSQPTPSEQPPKRDLYPNELAEQNHNRQPRAELPWHLAFDLQDVEAGLAERLAANPDTESFAREALVGDRILAVIFHAGQWYAMDGICTHQGGPLAEGHVADGCVTCPWHGWQYELETGTQTTSRQPLQAVFPIRQNGTAVEVQLP
ncbi:Rieske (2Fe-2S) protein [Rhodopirellula sp. P2]|uniref:Rieske (2Fe-2S) protein n=1 Tax=Rhodopirellula sp. P2 TaxID=2127060 RepID=UPI00236886EB|nr:Rieske (2Fe-2S) protein [Rhodopirellula sp. P2]WDQ18549.1 Rieske (2Fe-2S) protein [Rhodopirellula sp. P2]